MFRSKLKNLTEPMQYQNIFSGKLEQFHRAHARGTSFCLAQTIKKLIAKNMCMNKRTQIMLNCHVCVHKHTHV